MAAEEKKLFLIDAMAHIYRAFYAPMARMNAPSGMPTKVPFLFLNIVRRILKDYKPDYVAIVFDTRQPTFRDKLFEKYKAQRPPMPDEMSIQLPYVRRLMEAMNLPILELDGYEADDVIGTMAKLGKAKNLEVLVVSNDKDMMQLVNAGVKILRTGTGGAKADTIVDAKKVEEILGVTPDKVIDLMALLGDTVDNIPGAKGIGEKGATELIQKYGSVENALEHAAEVPNKRYREALQQQVEQVKLSKQLAAIEMDVPLELDTEKLKARAPDVAALTVLYRELGFNSLLKELLAAGAAPQQSENVPATLASAAGESATAQEPKDYAQLANAEEFRDYLKKLAAKNSLAIWLNLEPGERGTEGFGTRIASIEVSSKAGEGRAMWVDEKGEVLKALEPVLRDSKRRKIVHDPKLFQLLAGKTEKIEHATQFYSYLLRPTTANHNFVDVIFRQFNVPMGGGAGERADYLQKLGAVAAGADRSARFTGGIRSKLICHWRQCWRKWSAWEFASTPKRWRKCRSRWKKKCGAWRKRSGCWRTRSSM